MLTISHTAPLHTLYISTLVTFVFAPELALSLFSPRIPDLLWGKCTPSPWLGFPALSGHPGPPYGETVPTSVYPQPQPHWDPSTKGKARSDSSASPRLAQ